VNVSGHFVFASSPGVGYQPESVFNPQRRISISVLALRRAVRKFAALEFYELQNFSTRRFTVTLAHTRH
jgi:hypothetical protein